MNRPFTAERLEELLTRMCTFWRHDVDVSLSAAREMALLEHRLGVSGMYYLMVDSPFYDADTAYAFACFLQNHGHKLGLHVDLRKRNLDEIAEMFPDAFVSAHCPRPEDLWIQESRVFYAYDAWWEGRYYADSRGRFAHGDPEDDHDPRRTLQINLHPEWWFEPDWCETVEDDLYEAFFHEPKESLCV